jgi:cellulose biosynthesis protein BcsQ
MNQWSFITPAGQGVLVNLVRLTTGPTWIFVIVNEKGGVGKTTTALNVSADLAAQGFAGLLIEVDLSTRLGYYVAGRGKRGVLDLPLNTTSYMLYTSDAARYGVAANVWGIDVPWLLDHIPSGRVGEMPDTLVRRGWTRPQPLHVLPSNKRTAELDDPERLRNVNPDLSPFLPQTVITRSLRAIAPAYDFIVIDTGPAITPTRLSAIYASTHMIVLGGLDMDSINEIDSTMATCQQVISQAPRMNMTPPQYLGLAVNRYNAEDRYNDVPLLEAYTRRHQNPETGQMEEAWVDLPFLGAIRADPDPSPLIKGAMNRRRPLVLNEPMSFIADDFHALTLNIQRASGMPLPAGER